jgi:hypothetical protein
MSKSNVESETATTKWRRGLYEKINREVKILQEEFDDVLFLRRVAIEVKRFRKQLTNRYD